jgi:hypothetical protein
VITIVKSLLPATTESGDMDKIEIDGDPTGGGLEPPPFPVLPIEPGIAELQEVVRRAATITSGTQVILISSPCPTISNRKEPFG